MKRKLVGALALGLFLAPFASAGIIRHVVKPVVKTTAKVVATTVKVAAKTTKAIVY